MQSDRDQEYLEAFCEIEAVGSELAAKMNEWNAENLDGEDGNWGITPDMSGDSVVSNYTEYGVSEKEVIRMLQAIGFNIEDIPEDCGNDEKNELLKRSNCISETVCEFIEQAIPVTKEDPAFDVSIEVQGLALDSREEVRLELKADTDYRKLPSSDVNRQRLLKFLQNIRRLEQRFSMTDEAIYYCKEKRRLVVSIRPYKIFH